MRIVERYSHLNGLEWMMVHRADALKEIEDVLASVDAGEHRTKVSKEHRMKGKKLYSPIDMNKAIGSRFMEYGWKKSRTAYWVASDAKIIRRTMTMPPDRQKEAIVNAGREPIYSYNQTDYVKQRVAVEVQFGKYAFVAFDIFVKHMAFFIGDVIDVGIEILPMKELQAQMSSGPGYYEGELHNLIRQGRSTPAVPLVLLGVAP